MSVKIVSVGFLKLKASNVPPIEAHSLVIRTITLITKVCSPYKT